MYDWPELQAANCTLWSAIAERLRALGIPAPVSLDRSRPSDAVWRDAGLVLSQTCGFPFSTRLRGMVRLVGTPIYDVPGCTGAYYSSMIVVRNGLKAERLADVAGLRFAYNSLDSLSGHMAPRAAMTECRVDPDSCQWVETGSHRLSILSLTEEVADVASIDAVCWALALRYEPQAAARLKIIETTPFRPGLPFITAIERDDEGLRSLRTAVKEALSDPATHAARRLLHIAGLGSLDEWDYGLIAALGR